MYNFKKALAYENPSREKSQSDLLQSALLTFPVFALWYSLNTHHNMSILKYLL